MSNWEYMIITSDDVPGGILRKDRAGLEEYLNKLGAEGWEVVNVDFRELDAGYAFNGLAKRPVR